MPNLISPTELDAVQVAVARFPEGASTDDVSGALASTIPRRTLQRRLALLVEQGRINVEGRGRGSRYRLPVITGEAHLVTCAAGVEASAELYDPLSTEGPVIKQAVRAPEYL